MPITSTFEPMVNVEYLKKISNKRFVHKPTIEKTQQCVFAKNIMLLGMMLPKRVGH